MEYFVKYLRRFVEGRLSLRNFISYLLVATVSITLFVLFDRVSF